MDGRPRADRLEGMRRATAILGAAALLLALPPLGDRPASAGVGRKRIVVCNNCWPAAFAFTPNGTRLFYAHRFTGVLRVKNLATGADRRWGRIRGVATAGEQGVLGLAVDPRWPRKKFLYVYYTNASPLQNRIVRLRKVSGKLRRGRLATIPASGNHNGGVIHFGPDGMLYAVTGDAGQPARSQNMGDNAGKVHRMRKGGRPPADNPDPGSTIYSFGHRNSFGFDFDPQTGRLWQTENGPECDDELNLVRSGRNYGWGPGSNCPGTSTEGPNPRQPKHKWNPVIAPTGAAFCDGCGLGPRTEGTLLVGAWNPDLILRLTLNAARNDVASQRILYSNPQGVIAVERAPDGRIYFSDPDGIYRLKMT